MSGLSDDQRSRAAEQAIHEATREIWDELNERITTVCLDPPELARRLGVAPDQLTSEDVNAAEIVAMKTALQKGVVAGFDRGYLAAAFGLVDMYEKQYGVGLPIDLGPPRLSVNDAWAERYGGS